jgi:NTP pyrophosphatase (non-canonical NTP hydrolase)
MELNEYQRAALRTAVYPGMNIREGFEYTLFGMLGEGGELANKYKKILRNREDYQDHRTLLMDELGDVLWYALAVASELGYTLEEVAAFNLAKLAARQATGTLKQHGDDWAKGWVEHDLVSTPPPGICVK